MSIDTGRFNALRQMNTCEETRMHIVSFKSNVRSRKGIFSAEARFLVQKLIRENNKEEGSIDSGDVLIAALSQIHNYTWLVRRLNNLGISVGALVDCRRGIPVRENQSDRAMRRMFDLIDTFAESKRRVGLEDLVMASLASDSEFLHLFVTEGLRRSDGTRGPEVAEILQVINAPSWIVFASEASDVSFERELQELMSSS